MSTKYFLVPGVINSNSGKVPIANNYKLTRFRPTPRRSYTAYERKVLFQCIKNYRLAENENDPNCPANNSKSLPWPVITEDFNSHQGISKATTSQLRNLYRNIIRKKRREAKDRLISVVKVEPEDDSQEESNQIKITDVVWADGSTKPVSIDDESEVPAVLDDDVPVAKDSGNSSPKANLPSKSTTPSTSKSDLMKVSSKAAEAFVELLNIAEPVTENNALVLKQKEEEHQLKMTILAEEHNMKMMILQAKLDYYRTLREKVISHTSSKTET